MLNQLAISLAMLIPVCVDNDQADQPEYSKSIDGYSVHVESIAIMRMRKVDDEHLSKLGVDVTRFQRAIVMTVSYPSEVSNIGPISIVDATGTERNLQMGGTPLLNGTVRPQITAGCYCQECWFPLAADENLLELFPIKLRMKLTPDDGEPRWFEIEEITP